MHKNATQISAIMDIREKQDTGENQCKSGSTLRS